MKRQNKLGSDLAVTAGVGCVSSVANAATTIVSLFEEGDIAPFSIGESNGSYSVGGPRLFYVSALGAEAFFRSQSDGGVGMGIASSDTIYIDNNFGIFVNNAIEGNDNFAVVDPGGGGGLRNCPI